jgi:hypothetical protein
MPTRKIGRDAASGRFVSVAEARERPATAIVETYHVSRSGVRRLKSLRGADLTEPNQNGRDL